MYIIAVVAAIFNVAAAFSFSVSCYEPRTLSRQFMALVDSRQIYQPHCQLRFLICIAVISVTVIIASGRRIFIKL